MRMVPVFVAAVALLLVGGCTGTRTNLTSFVDPSRHGQPPYTSVVVVGYQGTIEHQRTIETTVVELLTKSGVRAIRSIDIAPPTEDLSVEQWSDRLVASAVDVVLFIDRSESRVGESYVPPKYRAPTYYSPGYYSGGWIEKYPVAFYDLELVELIGGKTVWKAEAGSHGSSAKRFTDLSRDVAEKAVQRLIEEGFF